MVFFYMPLCWLDGYVKWLFSLVYSSSEIIVLLVGIYLPLSTLPLYFLVVFFVFILCIYICFIETLVSLCLMWFVWVVYTHLIIELKLEQAQP